MLRLLRSLMWVEAIGNVYAVTAVARCSKLHKMAVQGQRSNGLLRPDATTDCFGCFEISRNGGTGDPRMTVAVVSRASGDLETGILSAVRRGRDGGQPHDAGARFGPVSRSMSVADGDHDSGA
jgi:hypothetical protein